jgi:hypothetical protein
MYSVLKKEAQETIDLVRLIEAGANTFCEPFLYR